MAAILGVAETGAAAPDASSAVGGERPGGDGGMGRGRPPEARPTGRAGINIARRVLPAMADTTVDVEDLNFGTRVYDAEGRQLGTIRGFDADGFYVTLREGIEGLSAAHVRAGTDASGEAELMWRCRSCGEMGDIEALPEGGCPNCGAPREELYYYTDD